MDEKLINPVGIDVWALRPVTTTPYIEIEKGVWKQLEDSTYRYAFTLPTASLSSYSMIVMDCSTDFTMIEDGIEKQDISKQFEEKVKQLQHEQ